MSILKRAVLCLAGVLLVPLSLADVGGGFGLYLGDTRGEYEYPGFEDVRGASTVSGAALRLDLEERLSVEVGVMDMGSINEDIGGFYTNDEIDTSFKHLSLIGRLPLGESASLRGRIGMANWDVEENFRNGFGRGTDDDSGSDPLFGIGFEAQFSKAVSGSAEYQLLEFSPTLFEQTGDITYRTFLLGLHFHF